MTVPAPVAVPVEAVPVAAVAAASVAASVAASLAAPSAASVAAPGVAPVDAPGALLAPGLRRLLPGLALSGALAAAAVALGRIGWLQDRGLGALTLAIVLGMLAGNAPAFSRLAVGAGPGIDFARQRLLRLGVMLYGLRLTLQDIGHVGLAGVLIDALVLGSTFGLACWVGVRWLRLERNAAMLIGVGSSICGAAAVMGAAPVLRARAEQVAVAVATVVVFGTLSIFLYPALFKLNQHWPLVGGGAGGFGVYAGSTIHEVAQVLAAARSIGPEVADAAIIAKMVRVMMLAPFLIGLSAWLARDGSRRAGDARAPRRGGWTGGPAVPWFAFGFVGAVLLNSTDWLPAPAVAAATEAGTALLAAAMAALGLGTRLDLIRKAGIRPLLLGLVLFGWLVAGGALINRCVSGWMA